MSYFPESSFFISTLVKTSCKLANYAPMYVLEYMGFSKAGIVKKSIAAKLMKWLVDCLFYLFR
jgi:hypothetical protein